MSKCSMRLQELSNAAKPGPTRLEGAQIARENSIRRRVAKISKKVDKSDNKAYWAYGPLFGLAKKPYQGGNCKNIFSSNSGDSSDVTNWKRLYGRARNLFNSSSCAITTCACKKDNEQCETKKETL